MNENTAPLTTAFYNTCKTESVWDQEEAFGIVIPGFASDLASGFRLDTVAPTTNATQAQS